MAAALCVVMALSLFPHLAVLTVLVHPMVFVPLMALLRFVMSLGGVQTERRYVKPSIDGSICQMEVQVGNGNGTACQTKAPVVKARVGDNDSAHREKA